MVRSSTQFLTSSGSTHVDSSSSRGKGVSIESCIIDVSTGDGHSDSSSSIGSSKLSTGSGQVVQVTTPTAVLRTVKKRSFVRPSATGNTNLLPFCPVSIFLFGAHNVCSDP
jgi:hypothetical protein